MADHASSPLDQPFSSHHHAGNEKAKSSPMTMRGSASPSSRSFAMSSSRPSPFLSSVSPALPDLGSPQRLRRPLGPARPVDSDDLHGTMVAVLCGAQTLLAQGNSVATAGLGHVGLAHHRRR